MIAYGFNYSPLQYDLLLSQDSLFRKFFPKNSRNPSNYHARTRKLPLWIVIKNYLL